jgi:putative glutamine amidotransferase
MRNKPVVAVPADRRMIESHYFHIAGEKYLRALLDGAGVLPLIVPALAEAVDLADVLARCDGVLLTGSPSNIDPAHYDGEPARENTLQDTARDALTLPLATLALAESVPLFAICRGFQELNVALGGTLHQHVHEVPGMQNHKEDPEEPLDVQYGPSHAVNLVPGGFLAHLAGEERVMVNSLHGQGARELAHGVTVEAIADDGLVEAYTVDDAGAFALAVQWHPEWRMQENPFSERLFGAFGKACRDRAEQRKV